MDDRCHELVSRLLGRIVHDFNNPLAAIIGFADLLRNPGITPEKRERYVARIYEQSARLSQLVENMSFFSTAPEPQLSTFNLARVVADVFTLRQGSFQANSIDLAYGMPSEEVLVSGDRTAVSRVVHTLLNNCEQVFKEHPGTRRRATAVACREEEGFGVVDVVDSGPGVPQDIAARIFDPFFSTRRSGGLGLGLSIARGLVNKMGGTLELTPDPEAPLEGALFRLRLPLAIRLHQ